MACGANEGAQIVQLAEQNRPMSTELVDDTVATWTIKEIQWRHLSGQEIKRNWTLPSLVIRDSGEWEIVPSRPVPIWLVGGGRKTCVERFPVTW
ncbi:hypothetical protein Q3G72_028251 [Acer saccharum]|nr:hypothetical protein Q3G72_028251 [Acer saccharum]